MLNLQYSLWIFNNLMQRLKHIECNYSHYFSDLLLLFYALAILENLYMICFFWNLLFDNDNTINQRYQK